MRLFAFLLVFFVGKFNPSTAQRDQLKTPGLLWRVDVTSPGQPWHESEGIKAMLDNEAITFFFFFFFFFSGSIMNRAATVHFT